MKQTAVILFIALNIGAILALPVEEDVDKGGVKECLLEVVKNLTNCLIGGDHLNYESHEHWDYDETSESDEQNWIGNELSGGDAKKCFKTALKDFLKCFTGFKDAELSSDKIMPLPMIMPFHDKKIRKLMVHLVV